MTLTEDQLRTLNGGQPVDHLIEEYQARQAEFRALLEAGVHPKMANRIMIVRHRLEPTP